MKLWLSVGLLALVLTACGQAASALPAASAEDAEPAPASPTEAAMTEIAAEATAETEIEATALATEESAASTSAASASTPTLLPEEPPPRGAEREFSTDFSKHSVPYSEILSGGPPKDGIPAIDEPKFVTVDEADAWLKPQEPVILFQNDDEARAYPLQVRLLPSTEGWMTKC
jgi:hypothetical protein